MISTGINLCLRNITNVKSSIPMAVPVPVHHKDAETLAYNLLKAGKVIALPTDTIYGLACSAVNISAINKLYCIKQRNEDKPVAICVGEVSDVQKWACVNHLPDGILTALLPGPVTLVLKCANKLDKSVSSYGKVGIRIPNYSFIRVIAKKLKCPLALTSANISSQPSAISVEEFQVLWDKVAAVFDGGCLGIDSASRKGSTVVDLSVTGQYKVIRPGVAHTETVNILQKFGLEPI